MGTAIASEGARCIYSDTDKLKLVKKLKADRHFSDTFVLVTDNKTEDVFRYLKDKTDYKRDAVEKVFLMEKNFYCIVYLRID